jgi:molecular chaperone DnaJ
MAPSKEWFEKDFYKILEIDQNATDKEIARAYRKLAKKYHPDVNSGNEAKFKDISLAYEVLSDPNKRKEYDEIRNLTKTAGFRTNYSNTRGSPFRIDDISDLFGSIFKNVDFGGFKGVNQRRGKDLQAEVTIGFEDSIKGVTVNVPVMVEKICPTCAGSGAAPGSKPVVCDRCNGSGFVQDNKGLFSLASTCRSCGGKGVKILQPCPTCSGTGVVKSSVPIKVKLPKGVKDGQTVKIKGKGEAGINGGPSGDLYVKVHVTSHRLFTRQGNDLSIKIPITYSEAVLGTTISVPSIYGGHVRIKIPPLTPNGKTFRVKGMGVDAGSYKGDLLITVEVTVPNNLTDEEKKAVENLAKVSKYSPREYLGVS